MDIPTVTLSNTNVIITWTVPNSHSSAVTAFDIEIRTKIGGYVTAPSCLGADPLIVAALTCTIPM